MLGTLAKWLRILGYDTLFSPSWDDHELVRLARAEGRILLTRDRELARRRGIQALLLSSEQLDGQLRQIVAQLDLEAGSPRCSVCNEDLQILEYERAQSRVPAHVAETRQTFRACPACQRIYWRGTHWERMAEHLAQLGLNQLSEDR